MDPLFTTSTSHKTYCFVQKGTALVVQKGRPYLGNQSMKAGINIVKKGSVVHMVWLQFLSSLFSDAIVSLTSWPASKGYSCPLCT